MATRLTKDMRNDFVNAVMKDVPTVDYDTQAHELAQQAVFDASPPEVKALYDLGEKGRVFLETVYVYMPGALENVQLCASPAFAYNGFADQCPEAWEQIKQIEKLAAAQADQHKALRAHLTGVAASCHSVEKLRELLPEFEKYMPEAIVPTKNLPAVANLVADFVKAGWPKEKAAA